MSAFQKSSFDCLFICFANAWQVVILLFQSGVCELDIGVGFQWVFHQLLVLFKGFKEAGNSLSDDWSWTINSCLI